METFEVGKTYERYVRKVYRRPMNPELRSFDCGKRAFGLSRTLLLGCRPQVLEKRGAFANKTQLDKVSSRKYKLGQLFEDLVTILTRYEVRHEGCCAESQS